MANENEILEKATDKLAESLFSDELYSNPRHEVGIQNTEKIEIPAKPEANTEPATPAPTTETVTTTTTPVPEFDINKYVKENFGFDSPETAKEAVQKWRKAETEPKPEPVKEKPTFQNEESERLYNAIIAGKTKEAAAILRKQEEIEKAADLSPIEQIKLDLKFKNPKYSNDDIEDIIEEKYSYPKKPVQRDDELDSEFAERTESYNKEFAKVDRRIKREGGEAVENLQKHKQDLVLPDINGNQAAEYQKFVQQQKELEVEETKARENYKAALDKDYSNFKGYTTAYKDKEVDVPIEYKPTEQELTALKDKFANGFDADEFFANRWIETKEDKVVGFKVQDQMADVYLLENKQKIFDKIANDAAARAVDAYLKGEKNINFNSTNDKSSALNVQKTIDDRLTEKLWGA